MISAGLSLQQAMRARLLSAPPLLALLGGAHIYEEVPRGAQEPYILFSACETRDWSVQTQKAHEHFITLDVRTKSRSRNQAQTLASEIEKYLDDQPLILKDHALVNLRLIFWTVAKDRNNENFNAVMRFRAATEPNLGE